MNITNLVDVILFLFIACWGLAGFGRGFIKQGVMTIGTVLTFILAFYLKNPVAEFLSLNLPFFKFGGIILGATSMNILFYQLVSFIIVLCLLEVILKALIKASGIIETLLKITIIFGIPSKILGLILGIIEGVVVAHIGLFFLNQPMFGLDMKDATLAQNVMSVPGLSNITHTMKEVFDDIYELLDEHKDSNSSNSYNLGVIDVMLKHKVITVEYVEKLQDKGKLDDIKGLEHVVSRYKEEE